MNKPIINFSGKPEIAAIKLAENLQGIVDENFGDEESAVFALAVALGQRMGRMHGSSRAVDTSLWHVTGIIREHAAIGAGEVELRFNRRPA